MRAAYHAGVPRSPNLVVLLSDQHRADVMGCAGHPVVRTPNLDRLAAQGLRFERVSCQGPVCMPARASLLTERYVRDHGVFDNSAEVDPALPTHLHALRDAGWHTAVIGKTHLWQHNARAARGRHVREFAEKLRAYGYDEIHETVGKLANLAHPNPYTDHLAARGLLDAYRRHVGARSYVRRPNDPSLPPKVPMWDAEPIPLPPEDFVDAWHGQRAADWIESYRGERPFYLFVGFPGPHDPWDAPKEAVDPYRDAEIPLPASTRRPDVPTSGPFSAFLRTFLAHSDSETLTDDRIRAVRRAYYANVSIIDDAIGRIVSALARRGLLDSTWIFYTSDHGEMNGEHGLLAKMVFYDAAVRVPLLVRPPGGTPARTISDLVEHFDVSATLRALAGAREVPGSDARSLLGYLDATPPPARDLCVSENFGFASFETDRYKLVVHEDDGAPVQLFDRAVDPTEDRNLVADPSARVALAELLETRVRPFFATPARRPHPALFSAAR
jgi:choline-sulfatase